MMHGQPNIKVQFLAHRKHNALHLQRTLIVVMPSEFMDNIKLLRVCILLLSQSFIFFRFYFF